MRFEPSRKPSDDERILPLINVVFLLLIFFMLAGHLTASDPFHIEPPESASQEEPGPAAVVVLIGADGKIALNGATVDEAGLKSGLAALMDEGAEVRVKADGTAPAIRVVATMELMREAGVETLRLLTIPRQE